MSFGTAGLQRACYILECAEAEYGTIHAQALITLIADVEALDNAAELITFFDQDENKGIDDYLLLTIGSDYQVKLVATGAKYRRDDRGMIIWSSVTRLKLIEIARCK